LESLAPGFVKVSLSPWFGPLKTIEWVFPFQEKKMLEVRLGREGKLFSGEIRVPGGMTALFQKKILKKGRHKVSGTLV